MIDRELLRSALAPTAGCLSAAQLQACLERSAAETPANAAGHLADCPRCQAEMALLKSFLASEPLPDEGAAVAWISAEVERNIGRITGQRAPGGTPGRAGSSWWSLRWRTASGRFAVATMAVAVVAVGWGVWRRPQEPVLVADAGKHAAIMRSDQIARLEPTGDLPAKPVDLRWQPVSGAATYRVEVMEVDETILWSSPSNTSTVGLPEPIRDKMLPGKAILWRVTALAADGNAIATSQTERFRVVSPVDATGAR